MILATGLLAAGLALSGCSTAPAGGEDMPTPTTTALPSANEEPTTAVQPVASGPRLFLPGTDDLLHGKPVSSPASPTVALAQVIKQAAEYFPPGTKVLSLKEQDKQFTLDMNGAFDDQKFYSQGERITELAVYALVNSAASVGGDEAKPVQITVDGKPLSSLGEFDASDAIPPTTDLVARQ